MVKRSFSFVKLPARLSAVILFIAVTCQAIAQNSGSSYDLKIDNIFFKITDISSNPVETSIIAAAPKDEGGNLKIMSEYTINGLILKVTGVVLDLSWSYTDPEYLDLIDSLPIGNTLTFEGGLDIRQLGSAKFEKIVLPDGIANMPFFNSNAWVKSLEIPQSVTVLRGLGECSNLSSITYGSNIRSIANYAFRDSPLIDNLVFTDSLREIGEGAFAGDVSLTKLHIGKNVKTIRACTFSKTSIRELSFLDGVEIIEKNGLAGLNKMKTAIFPNSVRKISENTISGDSIETIILGSGIKSIPMYSFGGPGDIWGGVYTNSLPMLSKVNLCSVDSIYDMAFMGNRSLRQITLPQSVKYATLTSFYTCFDICIDDSPEPIDFFSYGWYQGFSGSVYLGRPLAADKFKYVTTDITTSPFGRLKHITIGDYVDKIPDYTFYFAVASDVNMPRNLKSIGNYSFSNIQNTELVFPPSLTSIGNCAFRDATALKSVVFSDSLRYIGSEAFRNAPLENLFFHAELDSIGQNAFRSIASTSKIRCEGITPPACNDNTFSDVAYLFARLEVPNPEAYRNAPGWRNFRNIVTTGIDDITADGAAISAENGTIKIEGADHAEIYAADGRLVFSGSPASIPSLPSGLYLVRAGTTTKKIVL